MPNRVVINQTPKQVVQRGYGYKLQNQHASIDVFLGENNSVSYTSTDGNYGFQLSAGEREEGIANRPIYAVADAITACAVILQVTILGYNEQVAARRINV